MLNGGSLRFLPMQEDRRPPVRAEAPSLAPDIVKDLMALMGLLGLMDLMVARCCVYF